MRNILIKQFIAATIFCGIASIAEAQVKVEKCGVKSPTAFAIITDSETLSKCTEEFHAYKQILEEEGLGTYIISADWKGPEEVKAEMPTRADSGYEGKSVNYFRRKGNVPAKAGTR